MIQTVLIAFHLQTDPSTHTPPNALLVPPLPVGRDRACSTESLVAMPEQKTPRLSDLKRALRWLRAQYQGRAEEAAKGQDRMIERIRQSKAKTDVQ